MAFRTYDLHLVVNSIRFSSVEIEDHYETSHADHMTDKIILELVTCLNHRTLDPVKEYDEGLKIFVVEPVMWNHKPYRLVWFYYEGSHNLTVRTAFRVRRKI
jgi:hypothetical protein